MNRKKLILLPLLLFLTTSLFSTQKIQKIKEENLAQTYRDWLKLVHYIILPIEHDVFLRLTMDRDRDIFIETFWRQRDPTPGTPENEFKEEHIKRFNYANEYYRRGTTREGWQTDMGRVYITLGPPTNIERFDNLGLVPIQGWSYYGDVTKEMPVQFTLLFYQRGGAGEFKLYDPTSDGPYQLLQNKRDVDQTDYLNLYEKLYDIDPTLADLSISIVPGEYMLPGYQPSPQNTIMLANILESAQKNVSPSYATHFLDYKGIVSTDYLTNYVESETNVSFIADPLTGLEFVHFAVAPKSLSIDYFEPKDQYFCNFRLDVSLRTGENILFQYYKDFPIYFPANEADRVRSNGISIEDSFPALAGSYRLIILLQNSVGKEFCLYEKDIVVPAAEEGRPKLSVPVLGYKLQNYGTQVHIPYKVLDKKLVVDPKNTFASGDQLAFLFNVVDSGESLWKTGEVKVLIKGMRVANPVQKSISLPLAGSPFGRIINVIHSFPLSELSPDYYELRLSLVDGAGKLLDESAVNFIVSAESAIPHPIAHAKGVPLSSQHLFHLMLARQADKTGDGGKAEIEYQKVLELAPDYKEGAVDYSNFLLKLKKYDRALAVSERVKDDEKFKFDYCLIRGRAQMGLGNFGEAIATLLEGNKIYNSDTRLLNALGYCYSKTGNKKQAMEIFNASLRLNPNQDEIKKLVAELGKS